jgi:hypothetical protein
MPCPLSHTVLTEGCPWCLQFTTSEIPTAVEIAFEATLATDFFFIVEAGTC